MDANEDTDENRGLGSNREDNFVFQESHLKFNLKSSSTPSPSDNIYQPSTSKSPNFTSTSLEDLIENRRPSMNGGFGPLSKTDSNTAIAPSTIDAVKIPKSISQDNIFADGKYEDVLYSSELSISEPKEGLMESNEDAKLNSFVQPESSGLSPSINDFESKSTQGVCEENSHVTETMVGLSNGSLENSNTEARRIEKEKKQQLEFFQKINDKILERCIDVSYCLNNDDESTDGNELPYERNRPPEASDPLLTQPTDEIDRSKESFSIKSFSSAPEMILTESPSKDLALSGENDGNKELTDENKHSSEIQKDQSHNSILPQDNLTDSIENETDQDSSAETSSQESVVYNPNSEAVRQSTSEAVHGSESEESNSIKVVLLDNTESSNEFEFLMEHISLSGTFCRICHDMDQNEELVSPCKCKGSLSRVHISCLQHWLAESDSSHCELCGFKYQTERRARYSLLGSIVAWFRTSSRDRREIILDVLATITLAPLAGIGTYIGLLMAEALNINEDVHDITMSTVTGRVAVLSIISLMTTLDVAYATWAAIRLQCHVNNWYSWYRRSSEVTLIINSVGGSK